MPPKFRRDLTDQSRIPEQQSLLEGTSDDDDFFLRGPTGVVGRTTDNTRINRVQNQVDEVIDIMQSNIGKVMERGDRLEDLQDKSDHLSTNASAFRMKAQVLHRTMWWKECRMRLLLAAIVIIILIVIFVPIIVHYSKQS